MSKQTVFMTMLSRAPNVPPVLEGAIPDREKAATYFDKVEHILTRYARPMEGSRSPSIDNLVAAARVLNDIGIDAEMVRSHREFFTNWVAALYAVFNLAEAPQPKQVVDALIAALPFTSGSLPDGDCVVASQVQLAAQYYTEGPNYLGVRILSDLVNTSHGDMHVIYRGLGMAQCSTEVLQQMAQEISARHATLAAMTAMATDPESSEENE